MTADNLYYIQDFVNLTRFAKNHPQQGSPIGYRPPSCKYHLFVNPLVNKFQLPRLNAHGNAPNADSNSPNADGNAPMEEDHKLINWVLFNRPGVGRAVLQNPSSLFNSLTFSLILCGNILKTPSLLNRYFESRFSSPSLLYFMCRMSRIKFHMSCVIFFFFFFFDFF